MVKTLFFILLLVTVMFYPMFISDNKVKVGDNHMSEKRPDIEFVDGRFFIYQGVLDKKGDFNILNIYKKEYIAFKLNVKDVLKKEHYYADKTVFKDDIITGHDVIYKNTDIELRTNIARYNKITKNLNGGKFRLFSKELRGYGDTFKINEKKDLFAENIIYYLKVDK